MHFHSIRFRLTAWYFVVTATIFTLFGVSSLLAIRASLTAAVDHSLASRAADVRDFLNQELNAGQAELLDEFREQTQLGLGGGLFRVIDERGGVMFRSPRFPQAPQVIASSSGILYRTSGTGQDHMRLAFEIVRVHEHRFEIDLAEPLHELDESLARFERILLILGPLFLIIASMAGYWMSSRALSPVDRITGDARRISINNLSERLQVPAAKDELQGLALTLNEMLERIDRAVRRIVQFTADASHELRAPVTLIHTAAEFSLRRERTREELTDALRTVLRESKRTSHLINDLLEAARADSESDGPPFAPVDIAELAREAVDQATTLAAAKNIRVLAEIPSGHALIAGDETALSRLFLVLLDNAVKYTGEGGEISFVLATQTSKVEAIVRDNGIGIAPDQLPHVFDRFWRADKVRSRNGGGAGLGLSIAKGIVEKHGGGIEVHSTVGRGSEFIVRLPRIAVTGLVINESAREVR